MVASATSVPSWEQSYTNGDVGGLLKTMLEPAHGFGKFLVVLLSLSVVGNMAITFYSISLNLQLFIPFFLKVPRYVFSTVGTVLYVPCLRCSFYQFIRRQCGRIGHCGPTSVLRYLGEFFGPTWILGRCICDDHPPRAPLFQERQIRTL